MKDPIVEEVRKHRQEHADPFYKTQALQPRLREIAASVGYTLPELRTVEELAESSNE